MPRPPNYDQERRDRDRIKAAKKAEKLAAKTAKKEQPAGEVENPDLLTEPNLRS